MFARLYKTGGISLADQLFYQDNREMIGEDEKTVIKLHKRFTLIYCNPTALAAMSKPNDEKSTTDHSNDKSVIVMDC